MKKLLLQLSLVLILASTTPCFAFAQQQYQTDSNLVRTKVGNATEASACWPTSGIVTQGPLGITSHASIQLRGGGEAVDIAAATGTPVYSTFEGTAKVFDCTGKGVCDGGYGNLVKIVPSTSPAALAYHAHLSAIAVADGAKITKGQVIGYVGATGNASGAHLHYEFRGLRLTPPNVPQSIIPATCDGVCVPTSVSSGGC